MSTLSDHAFPMHLHLHPHIAQLNLCLSSVGLGICLSEVWAGAVVPFCRPRFSRATVLNSGIPWSTVATLGFALVQVTMQLPIIASVGHLIPHGLG